MWYVIEGYDGQDVLAMDRAKAEAELGDAQFAASLGRVYDAVLARAA